MSKLKISLSRFYDSKHFNLIALGVIAVMTVIAYSNTFTASFHFDDNPSIVENPYIKRVTLDNIKTLLTGQRAVVNMTLLLNYQVGGLNVVYWHMFNTALHIANGYFVYLLILWTLRLPMFETTYGDKAKRMALFAALLFAVHPVQTESVTYIISRSELLAAFFYLGTFFLFIKGATTKKFGYYVGAFFASLLSMASKQWAVTLPAMIILYDYMFLSGNSIKTVLSRWKAYILIAIPWVYILHTTDLVATHGNASYGFNITTTSGITPWTYVLTSFNVLWTYIRLLFLPINQNLDYDYPIAKTLLEFPTILSFVGHVVIVGAAFWLYKKRGWVLIPFGLAWFYITLSPVQSFVPIIDVIFEHRLYLPCIGFFLAFVAAYEDVFVWWEKRSALKKSTAA